MTTEERERDTRRWRAGKRWSVSAAAPSPDDARRAGLEGSARGRAHMIDVSASWPYTIELSASCPPAPALCALQKSP